MFLIQIFAIFLSLNTGINCQVLVVPTDTVYLTYNEIIDAKYAYDVFANLPDKECARFNRESIKFETINPSFIKRSMDYYKNRWAAMVKDSVTSLIGAKDFFLSKYKYPATVLGSCSVKDIYITTMDLKISDFMDAAMGLLQVMQNSMPKITDKSMERNVLAVLKYYTLVQDPFIIAEVLSNARKLTSPTQIFWFKKSEDVLFLANLILRQNPTNVVLILPDIHINQLISLAYKMDLFKWNRRWIIMSSNGSRPKLAKGLRIDNLNVTTISVGNPSEKDEEDASMATKLADDGAVLMYEYLAKVCCKMNAIDPIVSLRTGKFNLSNINNPRMTTTFNVFQHLGTSTKKIGDISVVNGAAVVNVPPFDIFEPTEENIIKLMNAKPLRIAAKLSPPFVMLAEGVQLPAQLPATLKPVQLTGLSADLIFAVLNRIGVTYTVTLFPDPPLDAANRKMSYLESVRSGESDIAIGELSLVNNLASDFDFLMNFLYFSFGVLESPVSTTSRSYLWIFLEPFESTIWLLLIFISFVTTFMLAIFNYFSPNRRDYGFLEALHITFGALFQGQTMPAPNQWSARILVVIWWLFVFFFLIIYTTNYAALRVSSGIRAKAVGFDSLIRSTEIPFGYQKYSIADIQLAFSKSVTIRKVNYLSNYLFPENTKTTLDEKVAAVINGTYRLIGDSFTLEYLAQKHCLGISNDDSTEQYAIYLQKDTIYTAYLNKVINEMLNERLLEPMIKKYTTRGKCKKLASIAAGEFELELTLSEVGGIFIISFLGLIVVIGLALVECFFAVKLKKAELLAFREIYIISFMRLFIVIFLVFIERIPNAIANCKSRLK